MNAFIPSSISSRLGWLWGSHQSADATDQSQAAPRVHATISSMESALVSLQRILVWEDPTRSIAAIVVFHLIYWLVWMCQLRFYFVVFSLLLVHVLYTWWRDSIWPEISVPPSVPPDMEPFTDVSPGVLSAPEISQYATRIQSTLYSIYTRLVQLRADSPILFVLVLGCFWLCLFWLGRSVSGAALLYLVPLQLLTVPGALLHWVPADVWRQLHQLLDTGSQSLNQSGLFQSDECEKEFLPECTPQTTAYLEVAAGIVNGREPSPDCLELTAFSAGLGDGDVSMPAFDDDLSDDSLTPTGDVPGHLCVDGAAPTSPPVTQHLLGEHPSGGESPPGGSGAHSVLSRAVSGVYDSASSSAERIADLLVNALYGGASPSPRPSRPASESDFEMISGDDLTPTDDDPETDE